MTKLISVLIGLFFSSLTFAQSGEFKVSSDFMKDMHSASVSSVKVAKPNEKRTMRISPAFSLVSINSMNLSNDYFSTDYKTNLKSTERYGFSVAAGEPFSLYAFDTNAEFSAGYSYAQGTYTVRSSFDMDFKDNVSVQWFPISLGLLEEFSGIREIFVPGVKVAAGQQYIHQTGTLDGYQQSFWLPFWSIGARIRVLAAESQKLFQGIILEAERQQSFDTSKQRVNVSVYTLKAEFAL